jgi:hypothetical protein
MLHMRLLTRLVPSDAQQHRGGQGEEGRGHAQDEDLHGETVDHEAGDQRKAHLGGAAARRIVAAQCAREQCEGHEIGTHQRDEAEHAHLRQLGHDLAVHLLPPEVGGQRRQLTRLQHLRHHGLEATRPDSEQRVLLEQHPRHAPELEADSHRGVVHAVAEVHQVDQDQPDAVVDLRNQQIGAHPRHDRAEAAEPESGGSNLSASQPQPAQPEHRQGHPAAAGAGQHRRRQPGAQRQPLQSARPCRIARSPVDAQRSQQAETERQVPEMDGVQETRPDAVRAEGVVGVQQHIEQRRDRAGGESQADQAQAPARDPPQREEHRHGEQEARRRVVEAPGPALAGPLRQQYRQRQRGHRQRVREYAAAVELRLRARCIDLPQHEGRQDQQQSEQGVHPAVDDQQQHRVGDDQRDDRLLQRSGCATGGGRGRVHGVAAGRTAGLEGRRDTVMSIARAC